MTTDNLGTLAGLIADLENLHERVPGSHAFLPPDAEVRDECVHCWTPTEVNDYHPCPTIELVRKHKRAQYKVSDQGEEHWVHAEEVGEWLDMIPFRGTRAECEAWIERKVNNAETN